MAEKILNVPFSGDPSRIRRIHLIAIAGVDMASLAGMLRERGFEVSGSDENVYPPMSDVLAGLGITVKTPYDAANLDPAPDLVIIGNAVRRTNVEAVATLERGLPYTSMAEALRILFLAGKRSLVVAGTHGKTTTTAMLAWVLHAAGRDPSVMVGGAAIDFGGGNYRLGAGEDFVVEGDEYDTAFFDKGPKFLHYEPRGLILNAIEFDHADIYADVEQVTEAFVKLLRLVPKGAPVLACADFPRVETALYRAGRAADRFGVSPTADWRPLDVREEGGRTRFRVRHAGRDEDEVAIRLMGAMNVRNALAVYALCRRLELSPDEILPGLESFRGVRRRQEIVADGAILVLDDFAHHPTAIAGTIEAVRRRYPSRRLWAVFEPRSNTSRRNVFQEDFADALAGADRTLLARAFFKESDPLKEGERLDVDAIVARIRDAGREAETLPDPEAILARLREETRPGDVVVFMSNGAFGGLPRRFAAASEERAQPTEDRDRVR
jgi:UDP-N-acetylmuramate: L-alanyl-gamma-D-glutamyl-meso-diaminopimelate ligase